MIKIVVFLIYFFNLQLFAGYCYSVQTETGLFTPVSPSYNTNYVNFYAKKCTLFENPILFDNNTSYVGCYKTKKEAQWILENIKFNFKNPKIVYHKVKLSDNYIIFPNNTSKKVQKNLDKILQKYKIKKVKRVFPTKFYGEGIKLIDISKITFLPFKNLYEFYTYWKKRNLSTKVLILYDGVYSLEYLYKKLDNPKLIKRVGKKTYEIKIPIYVSPTAKFLIKNKIIRLETKPKPIFIAYHGELYIENSKISTWDIRKNSYAKREHIPKDKVLFLGTQKPRPYFVGLAGSHTYFINNTFKGLGYYATGGTFGIALVHYPKDNIMDNTHLKMFLGFSSLPDGVYLGNNIYNCMMGFYTNEAHNVVLLGNYIHDNFIYNVDPHDYSKNLIIARNITSNAHHAHGIIISRQVEHSIIAENITLKNHSNGIMLDRLANHNIIYKNLSIENGYMGIVVQESDNVLLQDNIVARNKMDGILIRNSLRVSANNNLIYRNDKNGLEVLTKNIDDTIQRNFKRDPYHKATSAVLIKNNILKNTNSAIMVKNSSAIYFKNNILNNKDFNLYGGDINLFSKEIIDNGGKFKLYGRGYPFRAKSTDLMKLNKKAFNAARKIYIDISKQPNTTAGTTLASMYRIHKYFKLYKWESQREGSNLVSQALNNLGFLLLEKSRKNKWKNKKLTISALTFLSESAIMDNKYAISYIPYLKYMIKIYEKDILKAYEIATKRMSKGLLFDKNDRSTSIICKSTPKSKRFVRALLAVHEYKMKSVNINNFLEFCALEDKNLNIFTPAAIKIVKEKLKEENKLKILSNLQIMGKIKDSKNNLYCEQYLNKVQYFSKETSVVFEETQKEDLKLLNPYIIKYLNKVNEYRIKKIPLIEIYKILKRNPG